MTETPTLPARFADAPRAKSHGGLVHTCNPGVPSGLPFGRKDPEGCARCWEMTAGAPARTPDWTERLGQRARLEAERSEEIKAHFAPGGPHARGVCGPVCTAFDW